LERIKEFLSIKKIKEKILIIHQEKNGTS
jgi:hypothetical protein